MGEFSGSMAEKPGEYSGARPAWAAVAALLAGASRVIWRSPCPFAAYWSSPCPLPAFPCLRRSRPDGRAHVPPAAGRRLSAGGVEPFAGQTRVARGRGRESRRGPGRTGRRRGNPDALPGRYRGGARSSVRRRRHRRERQARAVAGGFLQRRAGRHPRDGRRAGGALRRALVDAPVSGGTPGAESGSPGDHGRRTRSGYRTPAAGPLPAWPAPDAHGRGGRRAGDQGLQ